MTKTPPKDSTISDTTVSDTGIVNTYYTNAQMQQLIGQKLSEDGVVQLQAFLTDGFAEKLLRHITTLTFETHYEPMMYKYKSASLGKEFAQILNSEITIVTSHVLRSKIKPIHYKVLRMEQGDYTVMHDKNKKNKEILIEIGTWNDTYGGTIMFCDDHGNYTTIPAMHNSGILSNGTMQRFIKYINNHAKEKRYILIGELQ